MQRFLSPFCIADTIEAKKKKKEKIQGPVCRIQPNFRKEVNVLPKIQFYYFLFIYYKEIGIEQ